MQIGPSQVSSGNIAPKVLGPQKGSHEVMLLAGVVLFLAGLTAAAWFYGQTSDQIKTTSASEKVEDGNVSEILKKASALNQAEASTDKFAPVTAPVVAPMDDILHADVYFEVGRKGLTDEGKAQLTAKAEVLKHDQDYGILIQGYTDQQGSADYNKKLGLKRAETVKTQLLNAGVAEHRMKIMSLGEEGVLCVDNSEVCRHINRRVHLEIRKIGQEHMAAPAVVATPTDPAEAGIDPSTKPHDTGLGIDDLHPLNPEPLSGS